MWVCFAKSAVVVIGLSRDTSGEEETKRKSTERRSLAADELAAKEQPPIVTRSESPERNSERSTEQQPKGYLAIVVGLPCHGHSHSEERGS